MRKLLVVGTALAVATACATKTPEPTPTETTVNREAAFGHEVRITGDGVVPRRLVSGVGEEVSWRNESGTPVTVKLIDGTPPSGALKPGEVFTHTFETAGTFAYKLDAEKDPVGIVEVLPHAPAN
ncbi:cupredoxin domain-containing protein [Acrocarpospora catenulata]|uniref:cupredoxin domain-containing protein n=1 Tax=Acrocarpospora catenulata TaxID=2836182 RepID=UPI001BD99F34|nr:hypothetical protein [Acrocarpospora catenulata]